MEIILLQSSQADLLEILACEDDDMYDKIDACLETIRLNKGIGPVFHAQFRRKLVLGTTYGIFYSVTGERIFVSFIMDLRQSPSAILKRLKR